MRPKDDQTLYFNAVSGSRLRRTAELFKDAVMAFAIRLVVVTSDCNGIVRRAIVFSEAPYKPKPPGLNVWLVSGSESFLARASVWEGCFPRMRKKFGLLDGNPLGVLQSPRILLPRSRRGQVEVESAYDVRRCCSGVLPDLCLPAVLDELAHWVCWRSEDSTQQT